MNEHEAYLFDTFGYLIVEGLLDDTQVAELRETLRQSTEQFEPVGQNDGPLHWGKVWRDLLDIPRLSTLLEAIIGNHYTRAARKTRELPSLPTYRLDHINVHTHVVKGFAGSILHGGWKGTGGSQFSSYHDGQFYNGLVSVSLELYDTYPNDGGFGCVPGSHKANLQFPDDWRDLTKSVPACIKRIPARSGDAIVFTEALTHGTLPWTSDCTRQTLFYKFSPHGSTWSADFFNPDDFREYPDMDDRKLAILEPPNSRYRGRPTYPKPLARDTS